MENRLQKSKNPSDGASVLKIHQLSVNYEKTSVLWDISIEVPQGKLVAIVGPNGAGKSTLLKTALGLIRPISGKISFFGKQLSKVKKRVAYVPQRESVDWDFPITVSDLVLMGCYGKLGIFRWPSRKEKERVQEYLRMVGMENFSSRQISQLSGGQQQRVFLARALIQEADIYFMDEPFSGIDSASSRVIIEILQLLRDQGKSLFIVHHDLESVRQIFDWAILLNTHLIGSGPVSEIVTPEMIQRAYGKENLLLDQAAKLSQVKTQGYPSP